VGDAVGAVVGVGVVDPTGFVVPVPHGTAATPAATTKATLRRRVFKIHSCSQRPDRTDSPYARSSRPNTSAQNSGSGARNASLLKARSAGINARRTIFWA